MVTKWGLMRALNLYLDENPGWRRYLVLSEGHKWAVLLNMEDASAIKVPKAVVLMQQSVIPLQPSRMAKRLRRVAKEYGKENTVPVKQALKLLKEAQIAR